MKIRSISNPNATGIASSFNTHGLGEVIAYYDEGDSSSHEISDLEVQLPSGKWKSMAKAFKDKDIVPNNLHTTFSFPYNAECKKRGYNP